MRLECIPHESKRSFLIALLGCVALKYFTFMIGGSPEVVGIPIDLYEHLVEVPMPLAEAAHAIDPLLLDVGCEHRPKPTEMLRIFRNLRPASALSVCALQKTMCGHIGKESRSTMLRRNFILILLANVVLGAALPMLIIMGGLVGAWMAPQDWLATALPSVQMVAGIAVAGPISIFMGRFGRRAGFLLGAIALVLGGGLAIFAIQIKSFAFLCAAHAALGGALICFNFFRFAASEAVAPEYRAQAISLTLASGLVAALIGPEVFALSKDTLAPLPLAGAYIGIVGLGLAGAIPVLGLSMPPTSLETSRGPSVNVKQILASKPRVTLAILVAALSQGVMVLLMTPTPLAMVGCGFADTQAADVIRWHIVAMFGPGFVTGSIIARFGAGRVAAMGVSLLLVSAIIAWTGMELGNFYIALIVLGVGWNFAFVSSTQMLQSELTEEEAPALQGVNDTILAIAAALASLLSGALFMSVGWIGLATFAIPMPLVIAGLLYQARRRTSLGATAAG